MTRKQRAQVVELLRCAADIAVNGDRGSALGAAAFRLDRVFMPFIRNITGDSHWVSLLRGRGPVRDSQALGYWICGDGYEWLLLEAALRVEQGEWQ